jgi:hypothetical protein
MPGAYLRGNEKVGTMFHGRFEHLAIILDKVVIDR